MADEPAPPARKARKPKQAQEISSDAATESAPAKPQKKKKAKAKAVQDDAPSTETQVQDQPQPSDISSVPLPAIVASEVPTEQDVATSVLEDSVKRRGRPRAERDAAHGPSPEDEFLAAEAAAPIVSPEVVEALSRIEPPAWQVETRPEDMPKNWGEELYADAMLSQRFWAARRAEAKGIEAQAWEHHHHQNRYAVNRYLTVRRVARIMAEVENHDFMREGKAPHNIPSWARAEVIFREEFDEFNEFVKHSIASIGQENLRAEEEEQSRERMEHLDMVSPVSSRSNSLDRIKLQRSATEAQLVENYLDNILPGVTLSSLSDTFADDIFAADADDEQGVEEVDEPAEAA